MSSKNHDTVRVVNDQIGTPTYTYDLARLLVDMNETEKYGYYHATDRAGAATSAGTDLTKEIYRQAGYKTEGSAGYDCGIWTEQSGTSVQQPSG